uniref:Uncharacterized protein n=1 Tax=Eutreptiella gymnastica TaxID=73025 RepID=A0A7S4LK95_9EUGL|mmetsp:Transcript_12991/g.23656  ORF Transcript_12991/g.23656 Transcript_12991/m.23656 type:complete len:371 (+) Transcript_12991:40-1152(+)|eukprot:CAMPEP_0174303792 /NCGR_PEP_ID=MMETSP0809-20121228/60397_1 /TAXON_ID=73025 ORGANISM="Eutreptiella gymnastica-like, Strain CCMP1594" /NCGR_SAMPLE_ID=MMETSP0809 /ASSEMBLY_ACC=CAM_ASM_000658 /LENGTH=370 /DNA_ID=CAMNT_0015409883 /DNA_START=42 /DNA_END=1154 /DNA_ORIENTATION=+
MGVKDIPANVSIPREAPVTVPKSVQPHVPAAYRTMALCCCCCMCLLLGFGIGNIVILCQEGVSTLGSAAACGSIGNLTGRSLQENFDEWHDNLAEINASSDQVVVTQRCPNQPGAVEITAGGTLAAYTYNCDTFAVQGCDIADCSGTHIYNFNPISYNLYDYEKRLEMLVRDPSGSNLGYAQMRINDGAAGSTVTVMDFSRNTVALINERFGVWSYQVFNDSTATYYVQDPRVLTALTGWASRGVVEGYDCSGRNKCQRHLYQLDGCNVYFWFMNWIMIGIVVGLCYCCCCLACARGKEKQRQAAAKHRQEATALDLVDDTGDPYAPPHADAYAPYGDPIGEPIHLNTPQSDNSAAGPETVASVPSKSRA